MPSDQELCSEFGHSLYRKVFESARLRRGLEERWYYDTLQYLGMYDPQTEQRLAQMEGASKLFVNMTRPKTKVLRARLIDILFPTDEANWDIQPTPVPRLARDMAHVSDADPSRYPLAASAVSNAQAELDIAKEAVNSMRRRMADQLIESRYVSVGRQAITQACRLGVGVIKGPIARDDVSRKWVKNGLSWKMETAAQQDMMAPKFRFVDLWDFYPEMDAAHMNSCEHIFELHRMSPSEMRMNANLGVFDKDTVRYLLDEGMEYAPADPGHFIENLKWVRQLENELDETTLKRYLVFEYHGPINFEEYESLCNHFKQANHVKNIKGFTDDPLNVINGRVWFSADQILRFSINPLPSGKLPYSVFRLDPTENTIIGSHGVPRMLRDPQSSLNAAWRMAMESGGLAGVPMFIVDPSRVEPVGSTSYAIAPRKVWKLKQGESMSNSDGIKPIEPVSIQGDLGALVSLVTMSRQFMDDEANLPLVAQGEAGSGAKQTAHGMTLLANAVNVLFRDAARGFDDDITIPNMTSLYEWNMQFSDDEAVKGDMEVKALGSSVLLVNEIVSQNLLMLMSQIGSNPDMAMIIKMEEVVRLWFKTMRLDRYGLIKTAEEIVKAKEELAAQPPPVDPAVEAKREIAGMQIQGQQELAMVERETAILKLSQQEGQSIAKINADLEKVRMEVAGKERNFLAEAALKDRHGTGI